MDHHRPPTTSAPPPPPSSFPNPPLAPLNPPGYAYPSPYLPQRYDHLPPFRPPPTGPRHLPPAFSSQRRSPPPSSATMPPAKPPQPASATTATAPAPPPPLPPRPVMLAPPRAAPPPMQSIPKYQRHPHPPATRFDTPRFARKFLDPPPPPPPPPPPHYSPRSPPYPAAAPTSSAPPPILSLPNPSPSLLRRDQHAHAAAAAAAAAAASSGPPPDPTAATAPPPPQDHLRQHLLPPASAPWHKGPLHPEFRPHHPSASAPHPDATAAPTAWKPDHPLKDVPKLPAPGAPPPAAWRPAAPFAHPHAPPPPHQQQQEPAPREHPSASAPADPASVTAALHQPQQQQQTPLIIPAASSAPSPVPSAVPPQPDDPDRTTGAPQSPARPGVAAQKPAADAGPVAAASSSHPAPPVSAAAAAATAPHDDASPAAQPPSAAITAAALAGADPIRKGPAARSGPPDAVPRASSPPPPQQQQPQQQKQAPRAAPSSSRAPATAQPVVSTAAAGGAGGPLPQGAGGEENAGSQRRQLKVEDALAYLEKVKIQFNNELAVYNKFLDIMKEFKAQSIDTTQVICRVSELFKGYKDLILGFNTFLPPGYNIQVYENKDTGYLNTGFHGPEGYSELPAYKIADAKPNTPAARASASRQAPSVSSPKRKESKGKASSSATVPKASASQQPGPSGVALNSDLAEKESIGVRNLTATSRGLSGAAKAAANKKSSSSKAQHPQQPSDEASQQQVTEGTEDSPRMNGTQSASPKAEQAYEFERAIGFVNTIKERFSDSPDTFVEFLHALGRFRDERKGIREVFEAVASVFGPHKDLLVQFKEFLPSVSLGALGEARPMKSRPPSSATQRRPSAIRSVAHSAPNNRRGPGGAGGPRSRHRSRDMQIFEDLKKMLGPANDHLYKEFLKVLSLLSVKVVTQDELVCLCSEILHNHPDALSAFKEYLEGLSGSGDETMEDANQEPSSASSDGVPAPVDAARHARYLKKPVSEMGQEFGVQQQFSYRLLPSDFPVFEYSGRSALERKTLNDNWVSVTSGSEDYSFKFMRKNQNEDNLFRCEDDRYELDMLIETNASTIMKLETIIVTVSKLTPSERKRHALAAGALSPINFNCIQRIYGEVGPEVIDKLKINPAETAPLVLRRLKAKDAHWRQARMEMNRVWREVGERNYHRSLDHRSVHFKHCDKKELSTKSLLSDILDPVGSMAAREGEMTKARGYQVPSGSGGANDRSLAVKAVMEAASRASDREAKSLDLVFEELRIHTIVLELIQDKIMDESSSKRDAEADAEGLRRLVENFFDVSFEGDTCVRKRAAPNQEDKDLLPLYGDEAVYLFFRMYHLLFERVMCGLTLAREQAQDYERGSTLNRKGAKRVAGKTHIPNLATAPSSLTKTFCASQDKDHVFSLGPGRGDVDGIFEDFLELLRPFSRGKLDGVKFEEKCRILLGTGSYCLFSLDKTIAKTAKQAATVFGSDNGAQKMLAEFNSGCERLRASREAGSKLTAKALEKVQSVAALTKIQSARGAGANVFRFQCSYKDDGKCDFVIHAMGHTEDESSMKSRKTEASAMQAVVGFAPETGTKENSKKRRGGGSRDSDSRRLKKRGRTNPRDFLRFAGDAEQKKKRALNLDLVVENTYGMMVPGTGAVQAVVGGGDFMLNQGRKRKLWDNSPDRAEANEQSRWARVVRSKLAAVKEDTQHEDEAEKMERHDEKQEKQDASPKPGDEDVVMVDAAASEGDGSKGGEEKTQTEGEGEKKEEEKGGDERMQER